MAKTSLGTAYVQILPTTDGIAGNLKKSLSDATSEAGQSGGSSLGSSLISGFQSAVKIGSAALGAAAAGAASIAKSAIEEYANYEQLVGGVETLFGAGGQSLEEYAESVGKTVEEASASYNNLIAAQSEVMSNAEQAFKTAGMSQNEYMETVTSFSASLIQSLGGDTKAAASVADQAIIDMSDNANKMGTDIESIQNAYQGFAKQNYTMLDNLKLGYGGTKSEMERLIEDAEGLNSSFKATRDESGNLTMSFADIVSAIHIVQDNLGITGTTAKEASTTIQGSLSSMKAAWSNVLIGIADDTQDFDSLVDNLVESVKTFGENILPRIETALEGVAKLVSNLAPVIVAELPGLVERILPGLLEGALSLFSAFAGALPGLIGVIIETMPELMGMVLDTLNNQLPRILDMGAKTILEFSTGISKDLPNLITSAIAIINKLVSGLIDNAPELIRAALELMVALASGLIQAIPDLISNIPQICISIVNAFLECVPDMMEAGWDLILGLTEGIVQGFKNLWEVVKVNAKGLIDGVKSIFGIASPSKIFRDQVGKQLMAGMAEGITENEDLITDAMGRIDDLALGGVNVNADTRVASAENGSSALEMILAAIQELGNIKYDFYMDGKPISDNVTLWQRKTARAGGVA